MTMGLAFNFSSGNSIFIAADKRVTELDPFTGENTGEYRDDCEKVMIINQYTAVFVGGLVVATAYVKAGLYKINGIQSLRDIEAHITRLCQEAKATYGSFAQKINLPISAVCAILGTFDKARNRPVQICFSEHNNYVPVLFDQADYMSIKSCCDDLAFEVLDRVNDEAILRGGFRPEILIKRLFEEMSKCETQVSPSYDMIRIGREGVLLCGMKI